MKIFDKNKLPAYKDSRSYKRKVTHTLAWKITKPFKVKTLEGIMHCESGYLALDVEGNPYPIHTDIFEQTFEI